MDTIEIVVGSEIENNKKYYIFSTKKGKRRERKKWEKEGEKGKGKR